MGEIEVRTNLPAFSAQLRAIGVDFERKTVRSATAAAASVFRKLAAARAPVLQSARKGRIAGTLKRNVITVRSRSESIKGVSEVYRVTVRQGKSKKAGPLPFYWRFLEGGWIPRGKGQRFRGGRNTRALLRRRAIEGGARRVAYPFIAPAFAAGRSAALGAFYARIEKKLADYNRNLIA